MAGSVANEAIRRLRAYLVDERGLSTPIPLHSPAFEADDLTYVRDCLESGWVSSVGAYVERFEQLCAEWCGTAHAVATVNGTAALHVALHALGVGPGDAVPCPALTFVATANAIRYTGAEPVFLDSEWDGLGLGVAALERFLSVDCDVGPAGLPVHRASGRTVRVAVPVHIFGHPVRADELAAVCDRFGITVLEDATESLGATYKGRRCGSLGQLAALSFNGNKIVTTGGGGAVVTDDADLAHRLKHLTTTAKQPHPWLFLHDEVAFNYRLPNLNAALGVSQLERLGRLLERKRRLHRDYGERFAGLPGVRLYESRPQCESNYWLNALVFDDPEEARLFLMGANEAGLMARPCWTLMPDTDAHSGSLVGDTLATARDIVARTINIPSSPWMVVRERERGCPGRC